MCMAKEVQKAAREVVYHQQAFAPALSYWVKIHNEDGNTETQFKNEPNFFNRVLTKNPRIRSIPLCRFIEAHRQNGVCSLSG